MTMSKPMTHRPGSLCGRGVTAVLAAIALAAPVPAAEPDARAALDAALQAMVQTPAAVSDGQVIEALTSARQLGSPVAASVAVKAWLARQQSPGPAVLLAAAENAALAGDLKTAAARYKLFIAAAPAAENRSRAAGRLYEILVSQLGRIDDAYTFMARQHLELRQDPSARRFDSWLVDQALTRRDTPVAAATIAAALAEQRPLEQERVNWWWRLDAVMGELARARPEQFPAVPAARQILGLLRDSPQRIARYGLIVAWLEYQATAAGKDPAALAAAFEPVLAAATAYVDLVPTAAALADVQNVFVCGTNNHELWTPHGEAIRAWWTASFPKLSDDDKARAINSQGWWMYQATPAQWVELGAAFPEVFKRAEGTPGLPFPVNAPDPALYARQATFLSGVPSDAARIVNALAATGGTDLVAGFRHLVAAESWHGGFAGTVTAATQSVWPIWRSFPRDPAATDADFHRALIAWGPEAIARTPIALFHPPAAGQYLAAVFEFGGADPADRSHVAAAIRSLDWVPWDGPTRQATIKPAHDAFKKWAESVRGRLAAAEKDAAKQAEKPTWERAAAQIGPLEEEFKKALDPAVSETADLATVDPLAGHLARCVRALRARDVEAYVAAARAAYALVREYPEKKTPFGGPTLAWLVTNHAPDFDLTPWQCEVIADQMAAWEPGKPTAVLPAIDTALASGRPNGNYSNSPRDRQPQALAIADAIGKGIVAQLEKGHFDERFFGRFRAARRGYGWQEQTAGKEVLARLIDAKAFLVHRQRPGAHQSATADYQWLLRSEFQGLAAEYPPERFFDDMFVEEFKDRDWLDGAFLNYSRDEQRKAAALAAERFASYASLATGPGDPLGYDQPAARLVAGDRWWSGRPPFWSRDEFWQWHAHALAAAPPLAARVTEAAEAAWGKTRFDGYAMGLRSLPGDPATLPDPDVRRTLFSNLAGYLERAAAQPERVACPPLTGLTAVAPATVSPEELAVLLEVFRTCQPPSWYGGGGFEHLGLLVARALVAADRHAEVVEIAPQLWRIGRDTRNNDYLAQLAALTTSIARSGHGDLAGAIASAAIEMLGTEIPEAARGQLATVRSEALLAAGGVNPVPRSDPRWPLYEAQIAFAAGKLQSAWDRYLPAADVVLQAYRDLDPSFTTWLIRENTAAGNFDRARELGQAVLAWSEATPGALDAEAQAALLVSYADIALARREYPQARAFYERIAAAQEFDGTGGKRDAELRVAEVDRLARQFDRSKELLERLVRRPDRTLQTEAFYQLALLKTDQDEVEEAAGYLEQVFSRTPNHVGGRILEGRLNLMRRKYDVASKVKLGVLGEKKNLIPGKPLEVDLEDRNLAVVGKATQIEIRVWTDGGDEERFNLLPFGDSKTRFTGQIATQLGPPSKGDHVLQVLGGETVRYTFADSFAGAADAAHEPATLTVVTDADLFASSGAILSKEEQQNRALELMIRARLKLDEGLDRRLALSAARREDQIKPGNPINVRVVDPDRSTSAGRDTLEVRASTSSGDRLRVTLTETEPYSGIFEGVIPTGASQAMAYASDSTEGNDPNNPIGPVNDVPWIAVADNVRPKYFSIDLNDNVPLGTMTITAAVPGRKLKDVSVQTSLNGRDFLTRGQWRSAGESGYRPWDAAPRMELVRLVGPPTFDSLAKIVAYFESGRLATPTPLVVETLETLAVGPFDGNLGGRAGALGLQDWYVGHWSAAFELPAAQTRILTLDPKGKTTNVRYFFAIDGEAGNQPDAPLQITRPLAKGPHRIDVYAAAHRHAGLHFEVLMDSAEPPFSAPIPASFLSPTEHPALADAFAVSPAELAAEGDRLQVTFAPETRARVVRLVLADFETDAPAINAIVLTDAAGGRVLPTARSFAELAANDVLEIIPGDRITVAYDDPAVITPQRRTQEQFLTATFTDAVVSAAFVEYEEVAGERRTIYVPMRRYGPGDAVKVFINDPDMDVSDDPDRLTFAVRAGRGEPVTIEAIETEPHSGVFIGTVFPVAGAPQRAAEVAVAAGDDLIVSYFDRENTDPGIPWERTYVIEQTGSEAPQLRVYDVASRPLDAAEQAALAARDDATRKLEEHVPVTREIIAVRPQQPAGGDSAARVLADGPLIVELLHPAVTQSGNSTAHLFVQTEAGRERLGRPLAPGEFPLDAPGTIRLVNKAGDLGPLQPPPGARGVVVTGNRYAVDALGEGRYMFHVLTALGAVPDRSFADVVPDPRVRTDPPVLQIRGNDTIHVGYRYQDAAGEDRWAVQRIELSADPLFDVLDQRYRRQVEGTHVGDTLYLRLINPALDTTDDKDSQPVRVTTSGGASLEMPLVETFAHSGIFKGSLPLSYRDDEPAAAEAGRGLPVGYGDTVTVRYEPPTGEALERTVEIFKGGDGSVLPFTKQFKDPEIAVQTQFTVAESWFELAKRHRELGQESLARREIAQGKKLLEEAIRDYPATESRAQADYLLANLSFEFSKDAANEEIARQHALDAVTRFSDIVASHPDSEYAPKSQFKKGLVLEKLGQIDQACEEYVKLSYRYPDNELVAETIARLGQYFLAKGKEIDEAASALTDPVEREKVAIQGREMFTTAAQVFGRLGERFPQHALAMKTRMLSAQCYLRAKDLERSGAVFESIYKDPKTDKELVSEAMYWAGDVHLQRGEVKNAYLVFKKLTWDYPESKWAKFARGRLTEDALVRIETQLGEAR